MSEEQTQIPVLDPKEVEQTLIEQEHKAIKEQSPEDMAATMFATYFPIFLNKLNKLSNKATKRLIATLISEPLEDLGYKPQKQEEKDALAIGRELFHAKMIMWEVIMSEHIEQQLKEFESKGETNVTETKA